MAILNYTTEVPASRSIAEILVLLQKGGASAVLMENTSDGKVTSIGFQMTTAFGKQSFNLPANVGAVSLSLNASIKRKERDGSGKLKIPQSLLNDHAQAERIAWRIVKDWLEAQLALHEIGVAKMEQIMLPFAVDESGKTFYQRLVDRGGPLLLQ